MSELCPKWGEACRPGSCFGCQVSSPEDNIDVLDAETWWRSIPHQQKHHHLAQGLTVITAWIRFIWGDTK